MAILTNLPNTYDIAKELLDPDNPNDGISHQTLFEALQKHWTDNGCFTRIAEAVANGVLIEEPATRYRLGIRNGLPHSSHEREKLEQIAWLRTLLAEFETGDRECYCTECFFDFVDETHETLESLETPKPQALN